MCADDNRSVYESGEVVAEYAAETALLPAEEAVLRRLAPHLPAARMLDIGVGAGRTTRHFAGLVREYVGIDYAAGMVAHCQGLLAGLPGSVHFMQCDVRDLSCFSSARFDLVLFSFNGLDMVDHGERLRALTEIRRVCAPNGAFCFSSHNTRHIAQLPGARLELTWGPRALVPQLRRWLRIRLANPGYARLCRDCDAVEHAQVVDGAHGFRVRSYYVRPDYQLAQLSACGFGGVRAYSTAGEELEGLALSESRDPWLYYLCTPQ
ncbi:MAG: class I SAM-dependent methyltransferase [Armatimonadetes bacterium]|nr:class I SAM-dependent methyltransferase [Armatimonadota bacterium]